MIGIDDRCLRVFPHSARAQQVRAAAIGSAPSGCDLQCASGADEIMTIMQMGTVPHEACMETIRIWGEKVIPHFRKRRG